METNNINISNGFPIYEIQMVDAKENFMVKKSAPSFEYFLEHCRIENLFVIARTDTIRVNVTACADPQATPTTIWLLAGQYMQTHSVLYTKFEMYAELNKKFSERGRGLYPTAEQYARICQQMQHIYTLHDIEDRKVRIYNNTLDWTLPVFVENFQIQAEAVPFLSADKVTDYVTKHTSSKVIGLTNAVAVVKN